jgi:hypothetical protein
MLVLPVTRVHVDRWLDHVYDLREREACFKYRCSLKNLIALTVKPHPPTLKEPEFDIGIESDFDPA